MVREKNRLALPISSRLEPCHSCADSLAIFAGAPSVSSGSICVAPLPQTPTFRISIRFCQKAIQFSGLPIEFLEPVTPESLPAFRVGTMRPTLLMRRPLLHHLPCGLSPGPGAGQRLVQTRSPRRVRNRAVARRKRGHCATFAPTPTRSQRLRPV